MNDYTSKHQGYFETEKCLNAKLDIQAKIEGIYAPP